jgi:hypothetical protein
VKKVVADAIIEHFLANHRPLSNVVIHGNPP